MRQPTPGGSDPAPANPVTPAARDSRALALADAVALPHAHALELAGAPSLAIDL
jgi:hypothetical protein